MENRLYVRNLSPSVTLQLLRDLFENVGDVESSEFGPPEVRSGLQTAYITMRTEQGAADTIARFNGFMCEGRSLVVTRDEPHRPDPKFKSERKKLAEKVKSLAQKQKKAPKPKTPFKKPAL